MHFKLFKFALPLATMLVTSAASAQSTDEITFVSGAGETSYTGDVADDGTYGGSDARNYDEDGSSLGELTDGMADSDRQSDIANSVERMTAALLDMRVGPLAAAIEDARPGTVRRHVRRDSTIGDLAGRDSRYLPKELGTKSREMMGMVGGFAQAMAGMMPEFRRMGRELETSVRVAKSRARGD